MTATVKTPNGYVTDPRHPWESEDGHPVWAWRTDGEPHDFGTAEQAEQFIAEVWHDAKTKAEKADRDSWSVEVDAA